MFYQLHDILIIVLCLYGSFHYAWLEIWSQYINGDPHHTSRFGRKILKICLKDLSKKHFLFCLYFCILCVFRLNNVLRWWCKDNWCWCWITRGLCLLSRAMSRELLWQWDPMYGLYAFTSNVWIHLIHWIVGAGHCWILTDRTTTMPSLHDMTKIFSITSRKIFHTSTITVFKCMNNTRHISQYLILIYLL